MEKLIFGASPFDRCADLRARYHVIDSGGFIRWKSDHGFSALDCAGSLSDREAGEFRVLDTRYGTEYGACTGGEVVR